MFTTLNSLIILGFGAVGASIAYGTYLKYFKKGPKRIDPRKSSFENNPVHMHKMESSRYILDFKKINIF